MDYARRNASSRTGGTQNAAAHTKATDAFAVRMYIASIAAGIRRQTSASAANRNTSRIFLPVAALFICLAEKESMRSIAANITGFAKREKAEYNPSEVLTMQKGR